MVGTIAREKVEAFEKLMWRTTRGNLFFRHTDIEEEIYDPNAVRPQKDLGWEKILKRKWGTGRSA